MGALMSKVAKTGLFVLVAMAAACSDAVAPRSPVSDAASSFGGGVSTQLTATDTVRFSITIDPWRSTYYNLGAGNSLTFPAGSVCDPAVSSYGPTEWDKPCTAARSAVTVSVRAWLDGRGHPRVDFTPNLRFVPSVLPTGWVSMTFADYAASLDPWYNILYCKTESSGCVDESKSDPSLMTVRNPVTGKVTRRIKHFSGYLVGAGDDSTDTSGGAAMNRIGSAAPVSASRGVASALRDDSGYILVSGLR